MPTAARTFKAQPDARQADRARTRGDGLPRVGAIYSKLMASAGRIRQNGGSHRGSQRAPRRTVTSNRGDRMKIAGRWTGLALVFLVGTSGCAVAGHTSSPWEWGGGVRIAPGYAVGGGDLTAHPMASYTYLSFDGGHDSLWELGAQIRKPFSTDAGSSFWLGGEGALSYLNTVVDGFDGVDAYSDGTVGFSATALAGIPIGESRWGFNLYGGAGISHYGSTGINVRVGVDLQPWFLAR